ncbi:MAG TPA: hypothetical protein VFR06_06705 [Gallionellaceae bacterium]|nr:hypothetical protein [Gallionellaceae bacterium]
MNERKSLLLQLIQHPQAAAAVAQELGDLVQECEMHLAEVSKVDILAALKLFDHGQLTEDQLVDWARCLHGRTDVGYEFGDDGVVEEAMFWLANPALNWPIDCELHRRIVALFERRSVKRK